MTEGNLYYTEAEIMARHPEAERIAGTMRLVDVPDTDDERQAPYETMRRPPRNFRPE